MSEFQPDGHPADPAAEKAGVDPGAPTAPGGPDGDSAEVLGKLEALLGRLRGPDSPAAQPVVQSDIPTLTEPVHWASPAPAFDTPPAHGRIPTLTETVRLHGAVDSSPAPLPHSADALRAQVHALLDPGLEARLCERALADLDRALIDVQRGLQDELAAWRDDQAARIREQVRSEVERAVDEMVESLVRRQGPTPS